MRQSAVWIRQLHDSIAQINVNRTVWTPTVLIARGSIPRGDVKLPNGWRLGDVPLSPRFAPSLDSDRHAVVIDAARGRMYDFFGLGPEPQGGWSARAGVVMRLWGSGWYNGRYCKQRLCGPWGARASSAALGGGLIRASEVQAGVIPHALSCAAPKHLIGQAVSPATTSDGSGGSGAMPMGSRLQLDPSLDVSTLGLEPGEEMVARALQTYGAYIVDSSSSFACYARNVAHVQASPYPASWSNGISKSLLKYMRVVTPPAPPDYDTRAVFGQPYR